MQPDGSAQKRALNTQPPVAPGAAKKRRTIEEAIIAAGLDPAQTSQPTGMLQTGGQSNLQSMPHAPTQFQPRIATQYSSTTPAYSSYLVNNYYTQNNYPMIGTSTDKQCSELLQLQHNAWDGDEKVPRDGQSWVQSSSSLCHATATTTATPAAAVQVFRSSHRFSNVGLTFRLDFVLKSNTDERLYPGFDDEEVGMGSATRGEIHVGDDGKGADTHCGGPQRL